MGQLRGLVSILSIGLCMGGCTGAGENDTGTEFAPNMYHSVPYDPLKQITDKDAGGWVSSDDDGIGEYYNSNPNNPFNMNMRQPPENVVPRSKHGFLPYRIHPDSLEYAARVLENPTDSTAEVVAEGKALYGRFCVHCHGTSGKGDGPVGKVYKGVVPYVQKRSGGYIFHVITHGRGRMLPHASQIGKMDRWKITRYVQTLQGQ